MKLVIQVPCYNEEKTLPLVLNEIPKSINHITEIIVQIIDDGSTDSTIQTAETHDVDFVLKNIGNKGLGISFDKGLRHALSIRADILVNTDGDNQYPSSMIPDLIRPIINGEADIVVGDRQTSSISHFSPVKKFFQWLGTKLTIALSGEKQLSDAVSGFRAYSKEAMIELNVTNQFSYVLDTTIQASNKRIKTVSIPITTNAPTRPSRLFSNIWEHILKSGIGLIRTFAFYKPLRLFVSLGLVFFILGIIPIARFLFLYFLEDEGTGKIQSLIIGSILISMGFNCFALGIIGDLMGRNRILIENILRRLKQN